MKQMSVWPSCSPTHTPPLFQPTPADPEHHHTPAPRSLLCPALPWLPASVLLYTPQHTALPWHALVQCSSINPELSLSREGDMLSAGAHTQAIYKECNMSRVQTPPVPVFPRASAFSAGTHKVNQHVVSASKHKQ
jgi:hypothetical protein